MYEQMAKVGCVDESKMELNFMTECKNNALNCIAKHLMSFHKIK